jgi:hypothetical protein
MVIDFMLCCRALSRNALLDFFTSPPRVASVYYDCSRSKCVFFLARIFSKGFIHVICMYIDQRSASGSGIEPTPTFYSLCTVGGLYFCWWYRPYDCVRIE